MESAATSEAFSELVRPGVIAGLNRDNESSLKLRADNFCGCDLLPEDDGRPALRNEPEPSGPQVPLVPIPEPLPGRAVRLAGAAPGPDGPIVGPASEPQREGPTADASEPVAG